MKRVADIGGKGGNGFLICCPFSTNTGILVDCYGSGLV